MKLMKSALALCLAGIVGSAMALPDGAINGTAVVSSGAASASVDIVGTSICAVRTTTTHYKASVLRKATASNYNGQTMYLVHESNGDYWSYIETAGFRTLRVSATGTTEATLYNDAVKPIIHLATKAGASGEPGAVSRTLSGIGTTPVVSDYVIGAALTAFSAGTVVVEAPAAGKGFKTVGKTSVTLTIDCVQ